MNGSEQSYKEFFGFPEPPFQDEPDPKFLFLPPRLEAILTDMVDFLAAGRGVMVLEGESGVGKTRLAQALIQKIGHNVQPLILTKPSTAPMALTVAIATALAIQIAEENFLHLNRLADALQAAARQGQSSFLLIDDAQELTDQHLEEVWVLSQMEFQGRHLLPVVLVADASLNQRLASHDNPNLAGLAQEVVHAECLTPEETLLYVDHRLRQAGSSLAACFAEDFAGRIFALTGGNPRRINAVCQEELQRCAQANLTGLPGEMPQEGQAVPPGDEVSAAKPKFGKIFAAVTAVGLMAGVAAHMLLTDAPQRPSFRESPVPPTHARIHVSKAVPPVSSPILDSKPPTLQDLAELENLRQAPTAGAAPWSPTAQHLANEPAQAEALPPPAPGGQAVESEWTSPGQYEVSAKDRSLNKIVAAHYPHNVKFGFVAVLLANPQIIAEEIINPGQILILPKMHKKNNYIQLNDNLYYLLHKRYNDEVQLNKMTAKLKELKIRYLVRESEHHTAGKVYRIFLGGYAQESDLTKAEAALEE